MSTINTPMTSQLIDKLGLASFVTMSLLTVVCIGIGFFAVFQASNEMTWQQACIAKGGVPVQLAQYQFDCKF
jgi:hypothetical protein